MRSHEVAAANAWVLTVLPSWLVAVMTAVLTPLALIAGDVPRALRLAAWPAGAIAALGLVLVDSPGALAIATSAPYAGVAVAAGVIGGLRLLERPWTAPKLARSVGLVFLPAATTWLVAERAGHALLGYAPFWVLLTAAHFHVAGVYLMTILGRVTEGRGALGAAVAIACVASVPLTAAGIYGPMWLEVGAALGMAASGFAAGILMLTQKVLALRIAGGVLLLTMPLAGAFALRDHGTTFTILGFDPLGSMLVSHGALNVLVFAAISLVSLSRSATSRASG
ncbi:MAG: YndJ family transporter [Myxococcales bacterium]|nr:YndJ family transporter [Myxococcales bacterium]